MRVWLLRSVWITLPLTAGAAASGALRGWDDAPRATAAVLLWLAWGIGTLALLAPRPPGLTALRAIAPAFAVLAIVVAITGDTTALAGWGAAAATIAAAVLAADHDIALAAANAVAYGDERRFPLRTPPGLYLGPLPVARVVAVGGIAAGPVLLADGRFVVGAIAVAVGLPLAVVAARALHRLSRRWFVLVPAGVVVVDPFTLADPHLFVRGHVRGLRPVAADAPIPPATLDLRLGATLGTLAISFDEPADIQRAGRGRRAAETVDAAGLLVAVVRRRQLLEEAGKRRVRVEPVASRPSEPGHRTAT